MSGEDSRAKRLRRAQSNLATLSQRQDALFDGVALQAKDINAVAMDALSDDYSPQKWTADATALWINGASIWFNALFGVPVTDDDDDDNP